ncbi:hypothetical protein H10PHJ05_90 [Aeromonas phage HJ05]|nr:hypothetical protein H10PHJ05_90 [Aeromonas phage HJ05]
MAVAINSPNLHGRFPLYPALDERAQLSLSPLADVGHLRLSFDTGALLDGSILASLLQTTDLPDPSAAARNGGRSAHVSYLDATPFCSTYAMVWNGAAEEVMPDAISLRGMPRGEGVDILVNSGGPAAVVGYWGGHLHSQGILAPFSLSFTTGIPRFAFTHPLAGRMEGRAPTGGVSRISPVQIAPHLLMRGEPVSALESRLFRAAPLDTTSLSSSLLREVLEVVLDAGDRQMRVPNVCRLPSGAFRATESATATLTNQDRFLDVSRAFDGTSPVNGRGIYPMSLSYTLPRDGHSPIPRQNLREQLEYMFIGMGRGNPFVASVQQAGPRNTPMLNDLYGNFTEDAQMVSDAVRAMLLRCGWDVAAAAPHSGNPRFRFSPAFMDVVALNTLLESVEREMPQTILANYHFPQRGVPVVSLPSVAYSMQTVAVTLAAIRVIAIDATVSGSGHPSSAALRPSLAVSATVSAVDGYMDCQPFESCCGMVSNYQDKVCNWLQGALAPAGVAFIKECLVDRERRGGLMSIVASALRDLMGEAEVHRGRALSAVVDAYNPTPEVRIPEPVATQFAQNLAAATERESPNNSPSVRITDESRRHVTARLGTASDAFPSVEEADNSRLTSLSLQQEMRNALSSRARAAMRPSPIGGMQQEEEDLLHSYRAAAGRPLHPPRRDPRMSREHTGYFGGRAVEFVGSRLAANPLMMAHRVMGGPVVSARLTAQLGGKVESVVSTDPRTRSTDFAVDVPIVLRFHANVPDDTAAHIRNQFDGRPEQVEAVLLELLEGLLTLRLFPNATEDTPATPARRKPASTGDLRASGGKKRRIVIPDSGDKS